jgi:hypothetical protein
MGSAKRDRQRQHRHDPRAGAGALDPDRLLQTAVAAHRAGAAEVRDLAVDGLAAAWPVGTAEALAARLDQAARGANRRGWDQPDLADLAGRKLGARHVGLVQALVVPTTPESLERWAEQAERGPVAAVRTVVELLALLWDLPALPPITVRSPMASSVDPKVLGKVRGLLAKAESTPYPEEAEACTAKASALMARHAIDHAAVEGTRGGGPTARRIGLEDPYANAKGHLLAAVAEANRCRVVLSPSVGVATVFGYPADLEVTEVLFTSLLVQAASAMHAAGGPSAPARFRSRRFRQSFLVAFASRIGARLEEVACQVVDEAAAADGSGALLPVLAARRAEVDAAVEAACPRLRTTSISASDAAGWHAGTDAAERADLGGRRLADRAGRRLSA